MFQKHFHDGFCGFGQAGRIGFIRVLDLGPACVLDLLNQARLQTLDMRLVQAVRTGSDQYCRFPPVLLAVVVADPSAYFEPFADIDLLVSLAVANQEINTGMGCLLPVKCLTKESPRSEKNVPRPIEYFGGSHAVSDSH